MKMSKNEVKASKFFFYVILFTIFFVGLFSLIVLKTSAYTIYDQYLNSTNTGFGINYTANYCGAYPIQHVTSTLVSFSPTASGNLKTLSVKIDRNSIGMGNTTTTFLKASIYESSTLITSSDLLNLGSYATSSTSTPYLINFNFTFPTYIYSGASYKLQVQYESPYPNVFSAISFQSQLNGDCSHVPPGFDFSSIHPYLIFSTDSSQSTSSAESSYSIAQGIGTNLLFPYNSSTLGGFDAFKISYFGIPNDPYKHLQYQVVYATTSDRVINYTNSGTYDGNILGKKQNEVLDRTLNAPPISYVENTGTYVKYLYGGNVTSSLSVFDNLPVGTYYARSFVLANNSSSQDIVFSDLLAYSRLITFQITASGTVVENLPSNYYEDLLSSINAKATSTESYLTCQRPDGITDIGGGLVYAGCWFVNQLITPHTFTQDFFDSGVRDFKSVFPFSIAFDTYDALILGIDSISSSTNSTVGYTVPDLYSGQLSTSTRTITFLSSSTFDIIDSESQVFIYNLGRFLMILFATGAIVLQVIPKRKR